MSIPELGAKLEAALTAFLVKERVRVRIPVSNIDSRIITVKKAEREGPKTPPRLRAISESGHGRGTGRGRKDPAPKLLRPLKWTGKRAEFVQYIGGKDSMLKDVETRFAMTRANINGFLTNIHRDHGIGYEKDNATVKLLLPKGATWSNIWSG